MDERKKNIVRHVVGNYIRLEFPFLKRTSQVIDGVQSVSDVGLVPNGPVVVELTCGTRRIRYNATMQGHVAVIEDNGTLPIGAYNICLHCRDAQGRPLHFVKKPILEVVSFTDEGGVYDSDEYDVIAHYPVIGYAHAGSSAVVITDDEVILQVGGHIATDDDGDDEATINAEYGAGSISETDDEIIINI